jgi:REP-associated tyrosine transposase
VPRLPRSFQSGLVYHIINRGNGQAEVFHKPQDYEAFLDLIVAAKQRTPVRLFAFCLMPNHFHLVVEPEASVDLSRFMQWLMTSHVRRYHRHYEGSGHVWQGRFKSFPIQRDEHLLTVLRYVRQNPVRASLVSTESEWPWSSASRSDLIDRPPVDGCRCDEALSVGQLRELRECLNRQNPFGSEEWRRTLRYTGDGDRQLFQRTKK